MTRRMINSELFRNIELGDCEPVVRLLYIGTIVNADDEGRMRAHPKYLRAAIFPFDLFDDASMTKMRGELTKRGLFTLYQVDGVEYLQHPKWEKWQILRKDRVKSSDCPSPRNQAATICQPTDNQGAAEPNPTQPKLTEPNQTITPPGPPKGAFEIIWAKYPRREGKKAAEKHFKASVTTMKDWLDIQNALENYVRQIRINHTEIQYTKMGSTWFNNWADYVNFNGTMELSAGFRQETPALPPLPPMPVEKPFTWEEQKEIHLLRVKNFPCQRSTCEFCGTGKPKEATNASHDSPSDSHPHVNARTEAASLQDRKRVTQRPIPGGGRTFKDFLPENKSRSS